MSDYTKDCKAEEFADRIERVIFATLPNPPTQEQLESAKAALLDMYVYYRENNPCNGGRWVPNHICTQQLFDAAAQRIVLIEPVKKKRRKSKETTEQILAQQALQERAIMARLVQIAEDKLFRMMGRD